MRTTLLVAALLPFAAHGAEDPQPAEVVVVTGSRAPKNVMTEPASVSRIGGEELAELSPKHQSEALNRGAGVYVQRGSGAESLTAIRSPVLTGAGACGAFLVAEDNLPIRPVGFCNLNEMFELNYEQAGTLEVLRGPGSALYGASAVHGIVNLLTPRVTELPEYSAGIEGGSDSFARLRLGFAQDSGDWAVGAYGVGTDAPGWRESSGVEEAKLNLLADGAVAGGQLRLRAAGTVLNQETAGFIQGHDSYKDEDIARGNPNPEAFRDASSVRVAAHYQRDDCFGRACTFEAAGLYRRSRMDFVQHFLIGKPLEHNAQTSYLVTSTVALRFLEGRLETRVSLDAETAGSELSEFQPAPATDGSPAANAIRPAGYHYDYKVDSGTVGATLAAEWHIADAWSVAAGLRADRTRYEYDNRMIDGNTADDGTSCPGPSGCLYSRPADRTDRFDNLAPRLTVSWRPAAHSMLYVSSSSGFRPPEMTEMYRLQRQQSIADLDSEELDSVEAGWKFQLRDFSLQTAMFAMNKDNVILRDANGFNVSDGRTRHRGFEYEARFALNAMIALRAAGTWARHEYGFSRAIEGGETIVEGNDVDTAPRSVHAIGVDGRFGAAWGAALDVSLVGRYFLDAANTATYPGHEVANLRVDWMPSANLRASLRVDNLLDTAYADRADFAFGDYRYFPARGRAFFVSLDYAAH